MHLDNSKFELNLPNLGARESKQISFSVPGDLKWSDSNEVVVDVAFVKLAVKPWDHMT